MGDTPDERADAGADDSEGVDRADADASRRELRERVEEKYDFDDFGPREMAEMSVDEWEAAFDADSWITGPELLDRVERDLRARIAAREVFAVVERETIDGEIRLVAYSDEGYAVVHPDGGVEGRGTVLRDVKPTVALCSMPDYEVPDAPADEGLPDPETVPEGTGDLGNKVLQAVATIQLLAGLGLLLAPLLVDPLIRGFCTPVDGGAYACTPLGTSLEVYPIGESIVIAITAGLLFLLFGVFLFVVVANARLADRFRSEEYRDRLRDAGVESGERPSFVPGGDGPDEGGRADRDRGNSGADGGDAATGPTDDGPA